MADENRIPDSVPDFVREAEEAMARAEEDLPEASCDEGGFTIQEMEEILACMMAHEKMEMAKLGQ